MPEVELFGGLRDAANGAESVRVDGATETTGNSRYPRARKSFY